MNTNPTYRAYPNPQQLQIDFNESLGEPIVSKVDAHMACIFCSMLFPLVTAL